MTTVGAFEAKTHLSSLLDRVANGERITISRHGVPAAMLVPISESHTQLKHEDIVAVMRELRKRVKPGEKTVRQMIGEGRRL